MWSSTACEASLTCQLTPFAPPPLDSLRCSAKSGPEGQREFMERVRRECNLDDGVEFSLNFCVKASASLSPALGAVECLHALRLRGGDAQHKASMCSHGETLAQTGGAATHVLIGSRLLGCRRSPSRVRCSGSTARAPSTRPSSARPRNSSAWTSSRRRRAWRHDRR